MSTSPELTRVLSDIERGDEAAREQLWPLVYDELHDMARKAMGSERQGHTLQSTALVHEAWVKLVGREPVGYAGRTHFFATAAKVMRHILVDHARSHRAAKHGGKLGRVTLTGWAEDGAAAPVGADVVDVLALHDALEGLAKLNARQAQVIELRFFGGLDVEQAAAVLGVSERTVKEDWRIARAWLAGKLAG